MKPSKEIDIDLSPDLLDELRIAHARHLSKGGKMELNDFIGYLLTLGAKAMGDEN